MSVWVRSVLIALIMVSFVLTGNQLTQAQDGGEEMMSVEIPFVAMVGDEMAMCGMEYSAIGLGENAISITDFRFYVSNINFLTADGEAVPLQLEQDAIWQYANVALLDFEDGTAGCDASGNAALNGTLRGQLPVGDYVGLQFDMGVPFELNHLNTATAPAPLNSPSMWWNWAGGYKFIRIDTMVDTDLAWLIHIGSTACESPDSTTPPTERCGRPNITTITFDEFGEGDVVVADLGLFFSTIDLNENTVSPPGCMSGFDDPDCPATFASFGLDMETGACLDGDCMNQHFFRLASVDDVTMVETVDMTDEMNMDGDMDMDHSEHDESNMDEMHHD